ncbi:MAG TPA: hypothetical protein VGK40_00895, partial [Verrucomicrobiae bacterium]
MWVVLCAGLLSGARAAVRFDVFVGYDGVVPEASWFPVVCEIANEGPSFNATVEFTAGYQGQARLMAVELPTGTVKRFVMPVFSTGRYQYHWTARLLDEHEKVRAELQGRQDQVDWGIPLAGAMTRVGGGQPVLPEIKPKNVNVRAKVARLLPDLFPDNPISLEGLSTIYLNSERALELKVGQVNALLSWLHSGGHLIVGVEAVTHVTGNAWLRKLMPCDLNDVATLERHPQLQEWVRDSRRVDGAEYSYLSPTTPEARRKAGRASDPFAGLSVDAKFEQEPLPVLTGRLRDGRVMVGPEGTPLAITARRGRGQITALLFSPEREPFVSWKNRPYFWAKMTALPPELLTSDQYNRQSWQSLDGVFGAMIDSRQVRKLPVGWLLLLLVAYLLVIGPLDQFWLKKMNKQMLTWLTFPAYVACFSVLIYFIGYKLRAGESEWNELHVVDVMPFGEQADWRGHTYASVYSPVNAKYPLGTDLAVATLRGEFLGNYGGGQEASRATVQQKGNSFQAEIAVPVWTSQLYVGEWWRQDATPLSVSVTGQGSQWVVQVENRLDRPLAHAALVVQGTVLELGALPGRQTKSFQFKKDGGSSLQSFLQRHANNFSAAIQTRQAAFGDNRVQIQNIPFSTMAASFVSQSPQETAQHQPNPYMGNPSGSFITTPGQDLTAFIERGDAVLLAWASDYAPIKPMHRFS